MTVDVRVPQIGEAVSELLLCEWYKREGDSVVKGEPLFSIDSDKSVLDVEAFENGVLTEIIHGDGSSVMPRQVVARMETASTAVSRPTTDRRGATSPKARAMAKRRGTDLTGVTGSGVRGMVTAEDLASDRPPSARDPHTAIAERRPRRNIPQRGEATPGRSGANAMRTATVTVRSTESIEIVNVTRQVMDAIGGFTNGMVYLSIPHTTAGLFLGEDDEKLRNDYLKIAERLLAPLRPFEHVRNNNPNTEAHVMSAMFGSQLFFSVAGGAPTIGRYQNILFLELDGPKERSIYLNMVPYTAGMDPEGVRE